MSEIDVSKCAFYNNGKCNNPNGMACNCCNNAYCYYKQLQQEKLEKDKLKEKLKTIYDVLDMCENCNCTDCKYEDCDDCTSLNHNDIMKLIKQAKEGE